MTDTIGKRACELAVYMINNNATVRDAAKHFGISKSTVHKDVSLRLQQYDRSLFKAVRCLLENNKAIRHIRGGEATKQKYQRKKTDG